MKLYDSAVELIQASVTLQVVMIPRTDQKSIFNLDLTWWFSIKKIRHNGCFSIAKCQISALNVMALSFQGRANISKQTTLLDGVDVDVCGSG